MKPRLYNCDLHQPPMSYSNTQLQWKRITNIDKQERFSINDSKDMTWRSSLVKGSCHKSYRSWPQQNQEQGNQRRFSSVLFLWAPIFAVPTYLTIGWKNSEFSATNPHTDVHIHLKNLDLHVKYPQKRITAMNIIQADGAKLPHLNTTFHKTLLTFYVPFSKL